MSLWGFKFTTNTDQSDTNKLSTFDIIVYRRVILASCKFENISFRQPQFTFSEIPHHV